MAAETSSTLKSRTYVGLILAQFTNAFNDQASHIIGNFFACDMLVRYARIPFVDEKLLILLVTLCFILPLLIFSPLAGVLADKYSKRDIILRTKYCEVAFMSLGLVALMLPRVAAWMGADVHGVGIVSACLMILVVFLMGVQTAFLVPCKYGVMPEILHPSALSRGNGVLEATTFTGHLGGTAFGGFLYALLKHHRDVASGFVDSNIWLAGVVLLTLAIVGAVGASIMRRVPAASPDRLLTFSWLAPLKQSFGILRRSKPLALAVVGIAFASFLTLYCRQTLLYRGEKMKELEIARELVGESANEAPAIDSDAASPILNFFNMHVSPEQQAELSVATLIALVGLGVGIGSLLAGYWSGAKLELGLVPIGATLLFFITAAMAKLIDYPVLMYPSLVVVGISAGLYVVPMFTMLQHRAPKEAKGNIVATSNFVNVAGGVLALIVFYVITWVGEAVLTNGISPSDAEANPALRADFLTDVERMQWIPNLLFLGASGMTAVMLILICRQLPDFFIRSLMWLFSQRHYHLRVEGMHNLPQDGSAILATNCATFETSVHVLTATDRYVHFFLDVDPKETAGTAFLRFLSRWTSTSTIPNEGPTTGTIESALATLRAGDLVGLPLDPNNDTDADERFYNRLCSEESAPVVPVLCIVRRKTKTGDPEGKHPRKAIVVFGPPLPAGATIDQIQSAISAMSDSAPFLSTYPEFSLEM